VAVTSSRPIEGEVACFDAKLPINEDDTPPGGGVGVVTFKDQAVVGVGCTVTGVWSKKIHNENVLELL
jgi:hypothetical protein